MFLSGPLVVKELIFLDVINAFYGKKMNLLSDEEYDTIKVF